MTDKAVAISKLINLQEIANHARQGLELQELAHRRTGHTLGAALKLIGKAMMEPDKPVIISCTTRPRTLNVVHAVETAIDRLALKHIVITNPMQNTFLLHYNIYRDVKLSDLALPS